MQGIKQYFEYTVFINKHLLETPVPALHYNGLDTGQESEQRKWFD